ncbi:AAA family ATPase [Butyrivibrio sp. AC2005]|uniref:AAA family ATPase n=1 Tax=Butyrivibrio sp. AC2005 TaxID=1280672 RepID=UPI00040CE45B|nr:AAA family ATPase [Butyrivibrio sp. AC2005]
MTSKEAAEKWNISKRQVNSLCSQGKIPGAKLVKGRWEIPTDYVYKNGFQLKTPMTASGPRKYINIGNDGFRTIRNSEYIDKSGLISFMNSCLSTSQKLVCVSRPRRFGKSFGAKMLCAYYCKECNSMDLFEDLNISKDSSFKTHLNKHDVVYLDMTFFISTLKSGEDLIDKIEKDVIDDFSNILPEVTNEANLVDAFSKYVAINGQKLILIIDEWDAPFREFKGNEQILEKYINLLRSLFKSTFTDRLFDGVYMTGILPIKKYGHESAMSDFYEYSMVEPRPLQEYIGFTEEEVAGLCHKHGISFDDLKAWYDGYHVADEHLFNPKSVMESILRKKMSNYWVKTETYESLRDYIDMNFDGLKDSVVDMIGGSKVKVDTNSFQNDLTSMESRDDVLTLLIHLGYLAYDENEEKVSIPNDEIKSEFVRAVKNGNKKELIKAVQKSDKLLEATWRMDEDTVAQIIEEMHSEITAPTFYNNEQALRSVIKMAFISSIDYYARIDELPTGKGFADMVFWPKKNASCPALIVELKWNKSSSKAIEQIDEKQYSTVFNGYTGTVLKVGINYSVKDKKHSCKIEKLAIYVMS